MAVKELSSIYRLIAEGQGREYELLFSLEGLLMSVMEFDPVTDEPLPLTIDDILYELAAGDPQALALNPGWKHDRFSHIVDFASPAIKKLIDILHEKNLREHRISRPEMVREIDSRSMMWLSKKPGFTIKQKIASEQRMMGVYHTTSIDTAENRLFKAVMEKLDELLIEKEAACKKRNVPLSDDEVRFVSIIHHWLKSDEASLIGRWNNTPPNNTLLNDKNYRKIWMTHLSLQTLNENVQADLEHLEIMKTQVFFCLTAAKLNLNKDVRFRQNFLFPNYKGMVLIKPNYPLKGVAKDDSDKKWKSLSLSLSKKAITLALGEGKEQAESEYALPVDVENLSDIFSMADQVCENFFPDKEFKQSHHHDENESRPLYEVAAVDLNSVLPSYSCTGGRKGRFTNKLVHQQMQNKTGMIACSSARSKLIFTKLTNIDTYSVHSVFDDSLRSELEHLEDKTGIEKACNDFARIIKNELHCQKCLYITNDDIDDFSSTVNSFKHSMNAAFSNIELLPRSIAALYSKYPDVLKNYHEKDEITIRDIHDDYEVQTKIRIMINPELAEKNPETKGYTFQRLSVERVERNQPNQPNQQGAQNPQTAKVLIPENLNRIFTHQDSFLLAGLFSADNFHFEEKVKQKKLPLGHNEILLYTFEDTSAGALDYNRLQAITPEIPLWCDFLPRLAMKDSSEREWVLVDPDEAPPIRPVHGKPVVLPISWHFIFPAGKAFYEFPLIQGEKRDKSKYFAFIKDSNFPLEQETECELYLTYTYGEPQPYKLEFIPVSEGAEFKSVVVKWMNKSQNDYIHNMPVPNFVREYTWEDMRHFAGRNSVRGDLSDITGEWLPDQYMMFGRLMDNPTTKYNPKKSLRFPAIIAWNNGRSIYDSDCDEDFRNETIEALDDLQAIINEVPAQIKQELMFFLSCLHKDTPDWFTTFLPKIIPSIEKYYDYPNWIAYALGDCSKDWQKSLLNKTVGLLEEKTKTVSAIRILSKANWRVNSFVYNLSPEDVEKILASIRKVLNVINGKNNLNAQEITTRFSACLECIVALCRLRASKDGTAPDEKMLRLLSPAANEDVKHIVGILRKKLDDPNVKVKTFLTFEITRPEEDNTPELLYAAYGYLSGKIDSNAIKVLEADFAD